MKILHFIVKFFISYWKDEKVFIIYWKHVKFTYPSSPRCWTSLWRMSSFKAMIDIFRSVDCMSLVKHSSAKVPPTELRSDGFADFRLHVMQTSSCGSTKYRNCRWCRHDRHCLRSTQWSQSPSKFTRTRLNRLQDLQYIPIQVKQKFL